MHHKAQPAAALPTAGPHGPWSVKVPTLKTNHVPTTNNPITTQDTPSTHLANRKKLQNNKQTHHVCPGTHTSLSGPYHPDKHPTILLSTPRPTRPKHKLVPNEPVNRQQELTTRTRRVQNQCNPTQVKRPLPKFRYHTKQPRPRHAC